jgi:hypothetical protein
MYVHVAFTLYTEEEGIPFCKYFVPIRKVTRRHMPEQVIVMFTAVVTLNLTIAG